MSRLHTLRHSLGRITRICSLPGGSCDSVLAETSCSAEGAGVNLFRVFSSHASSSSSSSNSSSTSTLRRVNVKGGAAAAAAGEASDAGAASTSGQSSSLLWMSTEVPGGSKPLRRWEKYYWGVGVVGVSLLLYRNLKKPDKTPEEIEAAKQKAAELEVKRKEHLRAVLMGQNFIESDSDPLDGLSPAQIVKFMEQHGIDPSDPLEGLTPDEIDAYVQKQEAARQAQQEQ